MTIQVPPPVGTSGQFIDSLVITSSTNRQIVLIGDSVSSGAFAPVTSSAGALVNVSSGTFTLSNTVLSLSSGTVTVSNPTTAVTVTNPTTAVTISNTSFTVNLSTVFSLSSTPLIQTASSSLVALTSAPLVVVATSGGTISVNTLTSGTTVIVSASSGLVQTLTSGATVLSSVGVTQVLTSGATVLSSAGLTQALQSTQPWLVDLLSSSVTGGTTPKYITVTTGGVIGLGSSAACKVFNITAFSTALTERYLQIYNVSSSQPTVGTTTPVMVIPVPLYSTANTAPGVAIPFPEISARGISFSTGISAAATTTTTGSALATSPTHVTIEIST